MNIGVASRFSVLKIEDEDVSTDKCGDKKQNEKKKQICNSKNKKKKVLGAEGKSKAKKKPKSKNVTTDDQWKEWKKLDAQHVAECYEEDLEEALLLSKVEYEEKKELFPTNDENGDIKKKKKTQKKDSKHTLSLEEFNNMSSNQLEQKDASVDQKRKQALTEEKTFFKDIGKDVEQILGREHRRDLAKDRETFLVDNAISLQIQEELEKKDKRIVELEELVQKLTDQLKTVKDRNKKLCNILGQGEMKEKAELLVHNQQLQSIKDELTEQVTQLHAALEQEKSKSNRLR